MAKRKRRKLVHLTIVAPDGAEHPVSGNSDTASANDLVSAACGKFLPLGSAPLGIERDGAMVAFYDPEAKLSAACLRGGDRLLTCLDTGQPCEQPSMLSFSRHMLLARRAHASVCQKWGRDFGHLAPSTLQE